MSHRRPLALLALALLLAGCAKVAKVIPFVDGPAPDPGLTGTHWQVMALEGGWDAGAHKLDLAFGADGVVSGFAGCRTFIGRYQAPEPGHLHLEALGPAEATRCDDEAEAIDQAMLDALPRIARYRGKPEARELLDAAGLPLMRLEPLPAGH